MRNRNKTDQQQDRVHENLNKHQIEHEAERDSLQKYRLQESNGLINEIDNEQEFRKVIRVKDEELENIFKQILQDLEHCTMSEMHPREKLPKQTQLLTLKKVLIEF